MDDSFEPYNGLLNNLYEWDANESVNLFIGFDNKFDVEEMNVEIVHEPFDDFKMWYNPGQW